MSLRRQLTETFTVIRPGEKTDALNNKVADWENPTRVSYPAKLQRLDVAELIAGEQTPVSHWLVFLPPEADVRATDRGEADGKTFELVGPPEVLRTPQGIDHLEARLTLVEG